MLFQDHRHLPVETRDPFLPVNDSTALRNSMAGHIKNVSVSFALIVPTRTTEQLTRFWQFVHSQEQRSSLTNTRLRPQTEDRTTDTSTQELQIVKKSQAFPKYQKLN